VARTILVSGTDAGVGKTWVACALGRGLRAAALRVVAVKPVETGATGGDPARDDGARLAAATGQAAPALALRRLAAPLPPALALEREGGALDFDEMVLELERLEAEADVLIIEGTGGLLTPLTWEWNVADLAAALGAHALIVGADRLGTVNHTLLTLSAAELAGLTVLGIVLTSPARPDATTGSNGAAIARLSGTARVHVAPWTDDADAATAALRDVAEWVAADLAPPSAGPLGGV
jgi:dethiobiotin synthase